MPQIAQLSETYASQVFWLLIFFGLIFFVIGRGMVPRVMATVEARDAQITADLAAAESARRAADESEAAWVLQSARQRAEAQALIAKAQAEATHAAEVRLAEAAKVTDALIAHADARIAPMPWASWKRWPPRLPAKSLPAWPGSLLTQALPALR